MEHYGKGRRNRFGPGDSRIVFRGHYEDKVLSSKRSEKSGTSAVGFPARKKEHLKAALETFRQEGNGRFSSAAKATSLPDRDTESQSKEMEYGLRSANWIGLAKELQPRMLICEIMLLFFLPALVFGIGIPHPVRSRSAVNGVASTEPYNWAVTANTTLANPFVVVQGVDTMYIDWGDGTSEQAVILSSRNRTIPHTYSLPGDYTVTIRDANNLTKFWAYGACSWSYNLSSVPSGLKYLAMTGPSNTVTGNVSALPSGLDTLMLGRSNTVTGNYASLPRGLLMYYNKGISGSVAGNLSDLPRGLTYFLDWTSANPGATGDIANLPSGLTFCDLEAPHNTSYGDISRLPAGLTYFNDQGYNTTSGNIAGLPSGIRVFIDYGSNTTTGVLSGIPANDSLFFDTGNNTVTGDLASVPVSVSSFELGGKNTVTGYTAPHTWNPNLYLFLYFHWNNGGGGLTASEVDSLFIDLDRCNWTGRTADGIGGKITVVGKSVAPPTSASAKARNDLKKNKHVIITATGPPGKFNLFQNYPNPFNPSTIISYQLSTSGYVTLIVYDVLGRVVARLVSGDQQPGIYSVTFTTHDLASGEYFYRLRVGNSAQTKNLLILK